MKRKFSLEKIFIAATVVLLISFFILMAVGVVHEINGPHLTEGYVIDKNVYPPTGRQIKPMFSITVKLNDTIDEWYVSENYYDGVHVGTYVKK